MLARQPFEQLAQHQCLAAVVQVGLHIVQGVEVDHEQAAAAAGRDGGGELGDFAEECDVKIVFVRVQQQFGAVVLDEEALGEEEDLVTVQGGLGAHVCLPFSA